MNRLYESLPAIHRIRDAEEGRPLEALLEVINLEFDRLQEHIDQTYDNWFIETCEEWLVPYLGDLLGVRPLHEVPSAGVSMRAYVANTLAYRRRKGTAAVLEQLARDTSGWSARAVEFFQLLATTQHLNHIRLNAPGWANLRPAVDLELVGGPFEHVPYSAEVRRIASSRGRYNIPNVGLFVWRLRAYPVQKSSPRAVTSPADGRYTFDPLGLAALKPADLHLPLFNDPQTEVEITHLAEEVNVPTPLRRRPLYDELVARRRSMAENKRPEVTYFGDQPVLEVFLEGQGTALKPEELEICNLEDWDTTGWTRPAGVAATRVAVDPALGRLCILQGEALQPQWVSSAYGFSGDLGGGPYNRHNTTHKPWHTAPVQQWGVSRQHTAVGPELIYTTLGAAVASWNAWSAAHPGQPGLIVVMDSASYAEDLTGSRRIELPAGSQLLIVAADWPVARDPGNVLQDRRHAGRFVPEGRRPHLRGNIGVIGTAPPGSKTPGRLWIDGLLIEGKLGVLGGNLGGLKLAHCTLVPGRGGLVVNASPNVKKQNSRLEITLERCVTGSIQLPLAAPSTVASLSLTDSIVQSLDAAPAIQATDTALQLSACTVLGSTTCKTLNASNVVFRDRVQVARRQQGCVRFSFVPQGSRVPRPYRCQPDLEIAQQLERVPQASLAEQKAIRAAVSARLVPAFSSTRHGHPAYAQLSRLCPMQITQGADNSSEMGAWKFLMQPQREANLRIALEEYLRFGLEAGLFTVT